MAIKGGKLIQCADEGCSRTIRFFDLSKSNEPYEYRCGSTPLKQKEQARGVKHKKKG